MILPNEPIDTSPHDTADDDALTSPQSLRRELLRAREQLRLSQLELRALANSMPQLAWIA